MYVRKKKQVVLSLLKHFMQESDILRNIRYARII